jgi:DNA-directed RNA polymerase specialized sigma24 family protein
MTMTSYDRLRSIGVSVETADALSPVVDSLSPKKREAFFLWAMGYEIREIVEHTGVSIGSIYRIIKVLRNNIDSRVIRR